MYFLNETCILLIENDECYDWEKCVTYMYFKPSAKPFIKEDSL